MAESVHSKLSDPPGDSPSAGPTYLPEAAARGERFSVPRVGSAPGIEHFELSQMPSSAAPVAVTCIDYSPDRFQIEEVHDIPGFLARHRPPWSVVRWIRIEGLTDMRVIHAFAEKYELHPLAIEDVLHLGQRPKCEDYPASEGHPGRLFVVAALVERATSGRLCTEQMSMFLGRNTLVTMHERPSELWGPIVQRIGTKDSRLRRNDVSFLLYCLLDALVDQLFPVLEAISDRLEELEDIILTSSRRDLLKEFHSTKRELSLLRRTAWPLRELIHNLHREHHECLSETTRTYLRDVYDHVVQVLDLVETYRDVVESLTEAYMTSTANRLNDIMKTLTVISTIFVPLTFLAGVYGMNIPIPESHSPWMYPLFWLVCLSSASGMIFWFRSRGWF